MALRKIVLAVAAVPVVALVGVPLAAPASANPAPGHCYFTLTNGARTFVAQCNLSGTGHSQFRADAEFCSVSGCEYVSGPWKSSNQISSVAPGGYASGRGGADFK